MGLGATLHCSVDYAKYMRLSPGWKEDSWLGWFSAVDRRVHKTSPSLTCLFHETITTAIVATTLLSLGYAPSAFHTVSLILRRMLQIHLLFSLLPWGTQAPEKWCHFPRFHNPVWLLSWGSFPHSPPCHNLWDFTSALIFPLNVCSSRINNTRLWALPHGSLLAVPSLSHLPFSLLVYHSQTHVYLHAFISRWWWVPYGKAKTPQWKALEKAPLKGFSHGHFHVLQSSFLPKPICPVRCPSRSQGWRTQHSMAAITCLPLSPNTDSHVSKRPNHLQSDVLSSQVECVSICWFFCLKCHFFIFS